MSILIYIGLGTAALNCFLLLRFGWPHVYERWLRYQARRRMAILKLSPKILKTKLRDCQILINHLEDEILKEQAKRARVENERNDLRAEVRTLIGRNNRLANEVRCDDIGSETEVYKPHVFNRFRG